MGTTELLFLNHYQTMVQTEQQEFITTALGLVWEKKDFTTKVVDTGGGKNKSIEKLFIPLSVATNPDILDFVRKEFGLQGGAKTAVPLIGGGDYLPKPNEVITSMGDLSKDEFMRLIGRKSKV